MSSLQEACERALLLSHVSLATVQSIMDVAESCGLQNLEAACKAFVQMTSSHPASSTGDDGDLMAAALAEVVAGGDGGSSTSSHHGRISAEDFMDESDVSSSSRN